jgi:hypothetical protein
MNKLISPLHMTRNIVLPALIAIAEFLSLPSLSMSQMPGSEKFYKSCAELQKHLNDNNPGEKYEGFEKAKMGRKYFDYEIRMVFCNGGIITDRNEGTVCRGYIAYSYARVAGTARYYGSWGTIRGEKTNLYDTDKGNYCRLIK